MSKKTSPQTRRDAPASTSSLPKIEGVDSTHTVVIIRETLESIVVAFVLAFLFRTFEAEAFVIPTGSMSPSLQGRHIDAICPQCGARFRTSASTEDLDDAAQRGQRVNPRDVKVVAGMCPMCRFPMPFSNDLPERVRDDVVSELMEGEAPVTHYSYPGDRILVNKYGFDFKDPKRWDVVVFKFPGDGDMNYIKRLVGLSNEELQIYQGDIFTKKLDDRTGRFNIERKPPEKVAAMLELVHDTDYEPSVLHKAGWPLRWAATTPNGWNVEATPGEKTVKQEFSIDAAESAAPAWLRYRHQVPEETIDWVMALREARKASLADLARQESASEGRTVTEDELRNKWHGSIRPQLITDFNCYNASLIRIQLEQGANWSMDAQPYRGLEAGFLGNNWVGDLAVDAEVNVEDARGELLLDLVEAGYHFRATIDLKTGEATLSIIDGRTDAPLPFEQKAKTPLAAAGKYNVRFANVDDQLLLWVNGKLVPFEKSSYEPDELFAAKGGRKGMIPWASSDSNQDQGDLAPVGVGARGAKISISRLAVLRDVYYTAAGPTTADLALSMDYESWRYDATVDGRRIPKLEDGRDLFAKPEAWPRFLTRRRQNFKVADEQLFVMGDNSPASADCRVWTTNTARGIPGGNYLDRRLLIGKADCVFWPHSWGSIPGLPQLPGFPNFKDMRLVR